MLATEACTSAAYEQLGDEPVARSALLDRHVEHGDLLVGCDEVDSAIKELGRDESLVRTLLESTEVECAGDNDGARVDGGHLGHRNKDPSARLNLDHQTGQARGVQAGTQNHDAIAHLADLVAIGIEDTYPREAGEEDPRGGIGRHGGRLPSLEHHLSLPFRGPSALGGLSHHGVPRFLRAFLWGSPSAHSSELPGVAQITLSAARSRGV